MPYITDNQRLDNPFLKKSVKLLPCQKEMVLYWRERGFSQRELARLFHCSRRLITFILDPEKQKRNLEARKERGGSKIYYDKDKHNTAINKHRKAKYELLKGISNYKHAKNK